MIRKITFRIDYITFRTVYVENIKIKFNRFHFCIIIPSYLVS